MELSHPIHSKHNLYNHNAPKNYLQHPLLPIFVLGIAALQTVATSGLTYGWNALLLILKGEGKYNFLCKDLPNDAYCVAEQLYLAKVFSIAYTCQFAMGLPIGLLIDYLGPRCSIIGHLIIMTGLTGLAIFEPSEDMTFDFNILFLILIFSFRYFISTRHYHYANLFPKYFNLANTLISTSCMLSGGIFPLMYLIWIQTELSFKTIMFYFIGFQSLFIFFCLVQPTFPIQYGEGLRFSLKNFKLEGYQKQQPCTLKAIIRAPDNSFQFAESSSLVTLNFNNFTTPPLPTAQATILQKTHESVPIEIITRPFTTEDSKYSLNKNNFADTLNCIQTQRDPTMESTQNNKTILIALSKIGYKITSEFYNHMNILFNKLATLSVVFTIWFFILTIYLQCANFIFYERSGVQQQSDLFAFIFSCMVPLGFTGSLIVAALGDCITPKIMLMSYCVLGLIFLLVHFLPFSYFYLFAFLLFAIIEDIMYASLVSSVSYICDAKKFCAIVGLFYTICGVTSFIAGQISSLLLSRSIALMTILYIFVALAIISIYLSSRFKSSTVKNK